MIVRLEFCNYGLPPAGGRKALVEFNGPIPDTRRWRVKLLSHDRLVYSGHSPSRALASRIADAWCDNGDAPNRKAFQQHCHKCGVVHPDDGRACGLDDGVPIR